jgi:hypothetical protein
MTMKAKTFRAMITVASVALPVAVMAADEPGAPRHDHGAGQDQNHAKHQPGEIAQGGASSDKTCHFHLHVTDEAERQLGGALYEGMAAKHHAKHGASAAETPGAHIVHEPQHGGAFFMAPNKTHHLEGVYSERCGFRLVFYNAFTKHIRADRFRALINVVPESTDEPEVMRFLKLSEHDTVLSAVVGDEVSRPFQIELYVEFPGSDEPQLFNINVPAKTR